MVWKELKRTVILLYCRICQYCTTISIDDIADKNDNNNNSNNNDYTSNNNNIDDKKEDKKEEEGW